MKYWDVNVIRTLWIWPCGAELLVQRWTLHQSGGGQRACRRTAEPGRIETEQFGPDRTGPVPASQLLVFCFFSPMILPWKTLSFDLLGIWYTLWQLVRSSPPPPPCPPPGGRGPEWGACLSVGSLQRHKATQHLFSFFKHIISRRFLLSFHLSGPKMTWVRKRRRMEVGGGGARVGRGRVLMKDCL